MRRLTFLLLILLNCSAAGLWAQDSTLPLKSGSVRFAVIGDMGTGDLPQYQVAQRMLGSTEGLYWELFDVACGAFGGWIAAVLADAVRKA